MDEKEQKAAELQDLADSIVQECKKSRPTSSLEKAISLLCEVLNQQPIPHPLRSNTLRQLVLTLLTRFSQWGWLVDTQAVLKCVNELIQLWHRKYRSGTERDTDAVGEEQSEMVDLAFDLLTEFRQSVERSSIDTAILMYIEVLELRPPSNRHRSLTLFNLADALLVRFHLSDDADDLDEAISQSEEAVELIPPPNAERFRYLVSLAMGFYLRFHRTIDTDDAIGGSQQLQQAMDEDEEASELVLTAWDNLRTSEVEAPLDVVIAQLRYSLLLRQAFHPQRSESLNTLAVALKMQFEQRSHLPDLEEAISLHKEALELCPAPHPDRSVYINNLSDALLIQFKQKNCLQDLKEAIALYREGLELCPAPHPDRSRTLDSLARALYIQFQRQRYLPDLKEATALHKEALELRPAPDPDRSGSLNDLALVLLTQFEEKGHLPDLEEAICFHREALELCPAPHPLRSSSLNNLANALFTQFKQIGRLSDLTEAITFYREALVLCPAPDSHRSGTLNNLANALSTQFQQTGHIEDLEEAITLHREAIKLRPAPHPFRSSSLNNLASVLFTRFEQEGHLQDLKQAISFHREALELHSTPHPDRHSSLNNLANALYRWFEQIGHVSDLEEAISCYREALILCPAPHPHRSGTLNNLASAIYRRFEQKGHLPDLEEAIALHREALEIRCPPHPQRSMSLNNLANVLIRRFEQKGHLPDLKQAIDFHREALELHPVPHPHRSRSLNNLACALFTQFEQEDHLPHLEEAITLGREALELQPLPHPDRSNSLSNLAGALSTRFDLKGHLSDLESAIALHREALGLRPAPHPARCSSLNGLATALSRRFDRTEHLSDIKEAITLHQELLSLLPDSHPDHGLAVNLAQAHIKLYSLTSQPENLQHAITAFREATSCETAPLLLQFNSSRRWARSADIWDHPSALEAFQHAINLLPRLSSLDMSLQDRQSVLTQTRGIASEACSWAVRAGYLEKAVEFLSAARAVFWSQAIDLRTSLDELQSAAPLLAEKLRDISAQLEHSSRRDLEFFSAGRTGSTVRDIEKEASRCRLLNDERIRILDEVRGLQGFNSFMLPKSFDKLQHIASNGPVVILNASEEGCHGLLLDGRAVKHIPLPNLNLKLVSALPRVIRAALLGSETRSAASNTIGDLLSSLDRQIHTDGLRKAIRIPDSGSGPEDLFQFVFGILWFSVVLPVISALELEASNSPPRLWWCPTGPFSFLPIHAAGLYEVEIPICLSDYVVSSYTPTLDALLDPPPSTSFDVLAVIEADTPGQSKLPYALKELEMIQKYVPDKWLTSIGTVDAPSSVEGVSSSLAEASFVHFACHGHQDELNPLSSALFLRDGRLTMAKIMERSLPKARLAFLNACETATGDYGIPDEAMHLSASFLFAGFRGVVGTMWPIFDADAPLIAEVFYGHLFRKGEESNPDPTEAAYALHLAVKKLRFEKKVPFKRWVPFIHLGV